MKSVPEYLDRSGYWIYNLKPLPDGSYEALLVFIVEGLPGETGEADWCDESGAPYKGVVAYPVKVSYEEAWVVTTNGDKEISPVAASDNLQFNLQYGSDLLPCLAEYTASGESGVATTQIQSIYTVDNTVENGGFSILGGAMPFDGTAKPDAEFASCGIQTRSEYRFGGSASQREGLRTVGIQTARMDDADTIPPFPDFSYAEDSGGSGNGVDWVNDAITGDWDGTLSSGGEAAGTGR